MNHDDLPVNSSQSCQPSSTLCLRASVTGLNEFHLATTFFWLRIPLYCLRTYVLEDRHPNTLSRYQVWISIIQTILPFPSLKIILFFIQVAEMASLDCADENSPSPGRKPKPWRFSSDLRRPTLIHSITLKIHPSLWAIVTRSAYLTFLTITAILRPLCVSRPTDKHDFHFPYLIRSHVVQTRFYPQGGSYVGHTRPIWCV